MLSRTTIVTAHFNEDLSWLTSKRKAFERLVVCSKTTAVDVAPTDFDEVHVIGNMGFEASAYIHYIVANYHRLPERIAFIHGHEQAWHQKHPRGMLCAIDEAKTDEFGFVSLNVKPHPDETNYVLDAPHEHIAGRHELIRALWPGYFEEHLGPRPAEIHHDSCAQFVVTKAAVLRNPYAAYKRWYDLATSPRIPNNKNVAIAFELLWHVIFGEPAVCEERGQAYLERRFRTPDPDSPVDDGKKGRPSTKLIL